MSETPFFKTRMGQRFYEHTVPELVTQLARISDKLDRLITLWERRDGTPEPPSEADRG